MFGCDHETQVSVKQWLKEDFATSVILKKISEEIIYWNSSILKIVYTFSTEFKKVRDCIKRFTKDECDGHLNFRSSTLLQFQFYAMITNVVITWNQNSNLWNRHGHISFHLPLRNYGPETKKSETNNRKWFSWDSYRCLFLSSFLNGLTCRKKDHKWLRNPCIITYVWNCVYIRILLGQNYALI